jgi:hypothetical protein
MLISFIVSKICLGQSSKCKIKQRALTSKLGKTELWFLCNAHLLNEINIPTKFHVDTSCCYRVMSRSKIADGQTDGQSGDYMLTLRVHKNMCIIICVCIFMCVYVEYTAFSLFVFCCVVFFVAYFFANIFIISETSSYPEKSNP